MQVELTKKMKICDSALPLVGNIFVHERTEKKEKIVLEKSETSTSYQVFPREKKDRR